MTSRDLFLLKLTINLNAKMGKLSLVFGGICVKPKPGDLWDLENLQGVLQSLLFTHLTSHGKISLQPTKFTKWNFSN